MEGGDAVKREELKLSFDIAIFTLLEHGASAWHSLIAELSFRRARIWSTPNSYVVEASITSWRCVASPQSLGVSLQLPNKFLERTCFGRSCREARHDFGLRSTQSHHRTRWSTHTLTRNSGMIQRVNKYAHETWGWILNLYCDRPASRIVQMAWEMQTRRRAGGLEMEVRVPEFAIYARELLRQMIDRPADDVVTAPGPS